MTQGQGGPGKVEDLRNLSIEQLGEIPVTSVSRHAEPINSAPAAIYVITHEAIVRSGAQRLAEILGLAPNLQINQLSAHDWSVSARGLSSNNTAQQFSNELLVMVDGRTIYTPLFSGVHWDMQDVAPEDIDRIEVISGPGATLWGANAVNGVINIITRKAGDTEGLVASAGAGSGGSFATLQYGGSSGNVSWRAFVRGVDTSQTFMPDGTGAHDRLATGHGGFRVDWAAGPRDAVMLEGDLLQQRLEQFGGSATHNKTADLLGRWSHAYGDGGGLQVQAYFDRTDRNQELSSGRDTQNTWDFDFQDNRPAVGRHQITWGGGLRAVDYHVYTNGQLSFDPAGRTLIVGNLFGQDSIALGHDLDLIAGLKIEANAFASAVPLPSLRLAWRPQSDTMIWAAVSRATRAITPFDKEVQEAIGGLLILHGNPNYRPVDLIAYEAGVRIKPLEQLSLSASAYYDVYNHLRSIELTNGGLPLYWGDLIRGNIYGFDAWGDYQATRRWRLEAAVSGLHKDLGFAPGASGVLGISQTGDDAPWRASLRSYLNLTDRLSFDADLRWQAALPAPKLPAYTELNASLTWSFTEHLQLALVGRNLLHARHYEFPSSEANAIPRSAFAQIRLRY